MLALPIALGVGGLQLLHEVGHLLAALRSNVKIGFPVAVPSLQAHRFSHSRSSQPLSSTGAAAPVTEPLPKAARRADTLLTGSHRSSVFTAASPGCSASRPLAVRSSTSLPPGLWWQVPPSPNAVTRLLAPVLARAELAARARPRERPAARLPGRPPLATACRRRLLAGVASLAVYLVGLVLSFDLPPLPAEPGALYPVLPTALLQSSLLLGTMAEAILPDLSSSQIVQLHPLAVIGLLASQTCQSTQREFPSATCLVDGTCTHAYAHKDPVSYPMPTRPVHQPGFTGALLNALQLLPVGRLDGGRLATAALGQGSHVRVSIVPGVVVTAATAPRKVAVCTRLRHAATSSPGGLRARRHGPYPTQPES